MTATKKGHERRLGLEQSEKVKQYFPGYIVYPGNSVDGSCHSGPGAIA